MKYIQFYFLLFIGLSLLDFPNIVKADLPVHCLTKEVEGAWKFHMSKTQNGQQACGHDSPDENTDHVYQEVKANFVEQAVQTYNLMMPNIVLNQAGQQVGEWTMVYDEGFEVKLSDLNFFAFSKYSISDSKTPKNTDDEQTKGYTSDCTKTFLGWYHDNYNQWGCFYGEKQGGKSDSSVPQDNLFNGEETMKIVQRDDLVSKGKKSNKKTEKLDEFFDDQTGQQENASPQPSIYDSFNNHNNYESTRSSDYGSEDNGYQDNYDSLEKTINEQLKGVSDQITMDSEMPQFKEIMKDEDINQQKTHQSDFYERFKQQLPLYDLPHSDYLKFNTTIQDGFDDDGFFDNDYNFIELVNNVKSNSPWKAKAHKQFEDLSHKQMKNYIGLTRFKQQKLTGMNLKSDTSPNNNNKYQSFLQSESNANENNIHRLKQKLKNGRFVLDDEEQVTQHLKEQKSFEQARFKQKSSKYQGDVCGQSNSDIPRCFDWRQKDGKNYDVGIKRQGECGSCYAVATISALESRIRIKSNMKQQPFLSASGTMGCSRYNQGCNGGYPYLVAKHWKEFGVYDESCQPYRDHDQVCKTECFKDSKVYRISDYGYVGKGYYGSTNEEAMKKEIFENGPVVVAFNAAPDLYYYDSGVFITNPTNPLIQSNDNPDVNSWQYTNHAVVCVGWGETMHNGEIMPYWILKNSWGEDWGQNGYFNMLRGANLGAIENQAVYMSPIIE